MFGAFVITLREGIEAALMIGLLIGTLKKTHRLDLMRPVFWGIGMAVIASGIGAVVLQFFVINEEMYEGVLYLTAAFFVSSMLYWMSHHARALKGQIEHTIDHVTHLKKRRMQAVSLFAFSFLMIFREGVETVLFLSAVGLTTEKLLSFIGGILGSALAVIFCVAFVKGTVRVNLVRFFRVSAMVLAIFIIQLLINGFHELSEAQVLPSSRLEMALVGPLVRNNAFFILAILFIPFLLFFIPSHDVKHEFIALSGPERRLQLASQKAQKRWRWFWVLASLGVILSLGTHAVYSSRARVLDAPLLIEAEQGWVKIPLDQLKDGKLHRFGLEVGDTLVRFLAIKTGDNRYAAALDLCEICGDYGYVQDGENVLCLNCVAAIYLPSIGVPGGCNPVPLASSREGNEMMIRKVDLESAQARFSKKVLPEVQCAICQMKLHLEEATKVIKENRTYYLCPMPSCKREFEKHAAANTQ